MRTFLIAMVATAAAVSVVGTGLAASSVSTIKLQSKSVRLPGPGRMYKGVGAQVLNENCSMCHSPTFVDTQPPLSEATWKAEVEKMRKTFGAPIPPDRDAEIVKALLDRHGRPTTKTPAAPEAKGATG
jgi:cytochrome c5